MHKKLSSIFLVLSLLIAVAIIHPWTPSLAQTTTPYTPVRNYLDSYAAEDQIKVLADIQPGFGIQMQEVGRRFTAIFNAARGGNWGLAKYQLKELREAAEVAEITRPARKDAWVSFENTYLGDATTPAAGTLQDAVNKENFVAFNKSFRSAISGCNGCHQASGFPYILFKLPRASELPLDFFLKLK